MKLILILIVILVITIASVFLITSNSNTEPVKSASTSSENKTTKQTEKQETNTEVKVDENCDVLSNNLDSCAKYKCQFKHPFTGELLTKEIAGEADGKCQYTEGMPNGGKMECQYTENMRKAVAQYYRDIIAATSTGTEAKTNLSSGETKTKYTIDGKEVENPLQEALNNGQCVISGY